MIKAIVAMVLTLGLSSVSMAGELDREREVTNRQLNGTLVLRVDQRSERMSYAKTDTVMRSKEQAKRYAKNASYKRLPSSKVRSELDRDGGSSSWYFYGGYYNNDYYYRCNWYGNYYNPYFYYNLGYYSYYYYGSYWW